jgi:thiol-disulfide isomerase/thioredoxin
VGERREVYYVSVKKKKMRTLLILVVFTLSLQCFGQKKYDNAAVFDCVELVNEVADSLQNIGEIERSLQIRFDSIVRCVEGLSLHDFEFTTVDDNQIFLKNIETPFVIKVTASWCAPCRAEIPAINRIAEEFDEEVKVIVLFWDDKESVIDMRSKYSSKIELIPSNVVHSGANEMRISGFAHYLGYPASYYLNDAQEIVYLSRGAVMERGETENDPAISKEEADIRNYERIKKVIQDLLESRSGR